jgi:hypothetical protein
MSECKTCPHGPVRKPCVYCLQAERDALRRELERWRHGRTIEGDYVCPTELERDALRAKLAEAEAARDRLAVIVDEAIGMQPVLSMSELLTIVERQFFDDRKELADAEHIDRQLRAQLAGVQAACAEMRAALEAIRDGSCGLCPIGTCSGCDKAHRALSADPGHLAAVRAAERRVVEAARVLVPLLLGGTAKGMGFGGMEKGDAVSEYTRARRALDELEAKRGS